MTTALRVRWFALAFAIALNACGGGGGDGGGQGADTTEVSTTKVSVRVDSSIPPGTIKNFATMVSPFAVNPYADGVVSTASDGSRTVAFVMDSNNSVRLAGDIGMAANVLDADSTARILIRMAIGLGQPFNDEQRVQLEATAGYKATVDAINASLLNNVPLTSIPELGSLVSAVVSEYLSVVSATANRLDTKAIHDTRLGCVPAWIIPAEQRSCLPGTSTPVAIGHSPLLGLELEQSGSLSLRNYSQLQWAITLTSASDVQLQSAVMPVNAVASVLSLSNPLLPGVLALQHGDESFTLRAHETVETRNDNLKRLIIRIGRFWVGLIPYSEEAAGIILDRLEKGASEIIAKHQASTITTSDAVLTLAKELVRGSKATAVQLSGGQSLFLPQLITFDEAVDQILRLVLIPVRIPLAIASSVGLANDIAFFITYSDDDESVGVCISEFGKFIPCPVTLQFKEKVIPYQPRQSLALKPMLEGYAASGEKLVALPKTMKYSVETGDATVDPLSGDVVVGTSAESDIVVLVRDSATLAEARITLVGGLNPAGLEGRFHSISEYVGSRDFHRIGVNFTCARNCEQVSAVKITLKCNYQGYTYGTSTITQGREDFELHLEEWSSDAMPLMVGEPFIVDIPEPPRYEISCVIGAGYSIAGHSYVLPEFGGGSCHHPAGSFCILSGPWEN